MNRINIKIEITETKEHRYYIFVLFCIPNKQRIIEVLSEAFTKAGINVKPASSDADLLISTTAIEASICSTTVVIGEDTDLLILLLHYTNQFDIKNDLYLQGTGKRSKSFNILTMMQSLGSVICSNILFLHAFWGCDTVSKPHGIGKMAIFRDFRIDPFNVK